MVERIEEHLATIFIPRRPLIERKPLPAERDLWQDWFNTAREINSRPEPGAGAQTGGDLIQFWQDTATRIINTQADLVRRWTGDVTRTKQQGKTNGQ
jgi:hypothetical protein